MRRVPLYAGGVLLLLLLGLFVKVLVRMHLAEKACTRAEIALKHKRYTEALAAYSTAYRLDPDDPTILINRANVYDCLGNYPEAIADYTEALRVATRVISNPSDYRLGELYYNRGVCQSVHGHYREAIDDYRMAIRIAPQTRDVYTSLAQLLATAPDGSLRNGREAVTYATIGCKQNKWKDSSDLAVLAAAYAESGDFAKAITWQQQAIDHGDAADLAEYQKDMRCYRAHKPYRLSKPPPLGVIRF
jgi:tetratricopeptide (TPR) repeat protein